MKMRFTVRSVVRALLPLCFFFLYAHEAFPKSPSVKDLLVEARELYEAGNYPAAADKCRAVLELDPNSIIAYNIVGMVSANEKGHEKDAINYFERSLELDPKQIELYNQLSFLYSKESKSDKALDIVEKGLVYGPDDFHLNFNGGLMYLLAKHDPYKALDCFKKSLKVDANHPKLQFLTGLAYLASGDRARAIGAVLETRRLKNEYLAGLLEQIIRSNDKGLGVNMTETMQAYNNQPKPAGNNVQPSQAQSQGPQSKGPPANPLEGATVKGSAIITVKTEMRPVDVQGGQDQGRSAGQ